MGSRDDEVMARRQWVIPEGDVEMTPLWIREQLKTAAYYSTLPTQRRVVVQAGGHIGLFPFEFSKWFKEVITFEPDTQCFWCLDSNCGPEIKNIRKYQAALGSDQRYAEVVHRVKNSGASYLVPEGDGIEFDQMTTEEPGGSTAVIQLDSLNLETLDLLCLDIEGYEYYALQGSENTIMKTRPIIVLESNECLDRYDIKRRAINDQIGRLDYLPVERYGRDIVYRPR